MARVDLNYRGIGDMLCSPEMQREMGRRARRIADRAAQIAPRQTGQYSSSFSSGTEVRRRRTRRAVGVVVNTDPAAFQIEFGTHDTPKHRTLGHALDAARD